MHRLLGALGPSQGERTPATANIQIERVKRRSRTGLVACEQGIPEQPFSEQPFSAPSFPERPPRIDAECSEIVMIDGRGRILGGNQAWRETLAGCGSAPPDAGIGALYLDVACRYMPALDRAVMELGLRRLLSGGSDQVRQTYAIRTPGGLRWRHVQITPVSVEGAGRFVAIHDDQTELAITQEALQTTSRLLLNARDEERQRIAIELHDSTSQHLAAISIALGRLRQISPDGGKEPGIIADMTESLNEALKETRVLSYLMEPRALGCDGLSAAVTQFLGGFAKRTGLKVVLDANGMVDCMPAPLQHAALRIVQEALLNAHRHAHASCVSVRLCAKNGQLTVSVADDGRGMGADQDKTCLGVGIPGMHARALQFSGHLTISSDEAGTRVVATLPLA